jgi:hypothetical protein
MAVRLSSDKPLLYKGKVDCVCEGDGQGMIVITDRQDGKLMFVFRVNEKGVTLCQGILEKLGRWPIRSTGK